MNLDDLVALMREDNIKIDTATVMELRRRMETLPEQHLGEPPQGKLIREGEEVKVTLLYAPEENQLYFALFNTVTATWGPYPDKNVQYPVVQWIVENQILNHATLSQALEIPIFVFAVEGAPRSAMDQHFRPRIGAAFAAQGVRDNDARQRNIVLPRELTDDPDRSGIAQYAVFKALEAYAQLVDKGASYQGARAVLPMGITNNWIGIYNWLALSNMMGKRLQLCEQPETVEVAWSMWEEVYYGWNEVWAKHLLPNCIRAGRCLYAPSYEDGQLFSDIHDPVSCPIYALLHPDKKWDGESTFKGTDQLAIPTFVDNRAPTRWFKRVISGREEGLSWFNIFREEVPLGRIR